MPRKNLRLLGAKPLIAWTIELASACPTLCRVVCYEATVGGK